MILSISSTQLAAAQEYPSLFRDGIVVGRQTGAVILQLLENNTLLSLRLFEAPIDCSSFPLYGPAAFHPEAELLAVKDIWIAAKLIEKR